MWWDVNYGERFCKPQAHLARGGVAVDVKDLCRTEELAALVLLACLSRELVELAFSCLRLWSLSFLLWDMLLLSSSLDSTNDRPLKRTDCANRLAMVPVKQLEPSQMLFKGRPKALFERGLTLVKDKAQRVGKNQSSHIREWSDQVEKLTLQTIGQGVKLPMIFSRWAWKCVALLFKASERHKNSTTKVSWVQRIRWRIQYLSIMLCASSSW